MPTLSVSRIMACCTCMVQCGNVKLHHLQHCCVCSSFTGISQPALSVQGSIKAPNVSVTLQSKPSHARLIAQVFGQVGSEVARRGLGLGFAKVIAYDPYASAAKAAALGVPLVTFDEALQQADFFSLHMPLTEGTKVGPGWHPF